jgi:hypothetical protein
MGSDHEHEQVQIPAKAINQEGEDIGAPTERLLESLHLIATDSESEKYNAHGFISAFTGPPESVAVIEAGATALSKWWAAGLGAAVLGAWGAIARFWDNLTIESTRNATLLSASIALFAVIIAISYIVGSDVRGRASAAAATINARALIGSTMLTLAVSASQNDDSQAAGQSLVSLPSPLPVTFVTKPGDDELGWQAITVAVGADEATRYLVAKGSVVEWAAASDLVFVTPTPATKSAGEGDNSALVSSARKNGAKARLAKRATP